MSDQLHPAATLFPMMSAEEFAGLKADIEANGQREPITYFDGQLLDGRNRLQACEELGLKPTKYELPSSVDPIAWVLSHNLHRRHLTTSQRSMVAANLASLKNGSNQYKKVGPSNEGPTFTTEQAAELLGVGESSVERAKEVLAKGSTAVIDAVTTGKLPVSTAAKFVNEESDKRVQTRLVNQGPDAVKSHITEPKQEPEDNEPTDKVIERARKILADDLRSVILQFGHLGLGGQADKEVESLRRKAKL